MFERPSHHDCRALLFVTDANEAIGAAYLISLLFIIDFVKCYYFPLSHA